jgi:hypothetical protein
VRFLGHVDDMPAPCWGASAVRAGHPLRGPGPGPDRGHGRGLLRHRQRRGGRAGNPDARRDRLSGAAPGPPPWPTRWPSACGTRKAAPASPPPASATCRPRSTASACANNTWRCFGSRRADHTPRTGQSRRLEGGGKVKVV